MVGCPHNLPEGRKAEWITGVQCGLRGEPIYIMWRCMCKESVTIQWDEATEFMKTAAREKVRGRVK